MKAKLTTLLMIGLAGIAQGAVTLQMSSTSNYLTNFLNGAGSSDGDDARMVWGIIVDANRDGFAGGVDPLTPYASGFGLSANANGSVLSVTGGGLTDDVIFIASAVMAKNSNANDGSAIGMNRVLSFSNLQMGNDGVGTGDPFALIWFDKTTLGGDSADGLKYGVYVPPASDLSFGKSNVLPADPGTYSYAPAFAGSDDAKAMSFVLGVPVPEPSVALLGGLGLIGLLRRRR